MFDDDVNIIIYHKNSIYWYDEQKNKFSFGVLTYSFRFEDLELVLSNSTKILKYVKALIIVAASESNIVVK